MFAGDNQTDPGDGLMEVVDEDLFSNIDGMMMVGGGGNGAPRQSVTSR